MDPEILFYGGTGIGGLFLVLFGYRLFQAALSLIGGVAGALYGILIVDMAAGGEAAVWLQAVGGLVGGLTGMGLALWLYTFGIFAGGAYLGFWIGHSVVEGWELPYPWAIIGVLTVLLGLAVMALERWTLMLVTAAVGAWHVAAAYGYFSRGVDLLPYSHPFQEEDWIVAIDGVSVGIAAAAFVLGLLVQKFLTARRKLG